MENIREEWKEATEEANNFTSFVKASGSRHLEADAIADWWIRTFTDTLKQLEEGVENIVSLNSCNPRHVSKDRVLFLIKQEITKLG